MMREYIPARRLVAAVPPPKISRRHNVRMPLRQHKQVLVPGNEVVRPGSQQRPQNRYVRRIASGVAFEGLRFYQVGLNSEDIDEVGEIGRLPLQAMIEPRQHASKLIEEVPRKDDFQSALAPGTDNSSRHARRIGES